jgi:hypothetical protein
VEVTLRRPPPLDADLRVDASAGTARLLHGDSLVAEAVPTLLEVEPDDPVTAEQARAAERSYPGLDRHPFPTCFVCGTQRGDGLGLRPGPVGAERCAAVWTPVDDDPVMVWAALDCPGGWAADLPGRPLVLGRIALERRTPLRPGEPHVVMGRVTGVEGRKLQTVTSLHAPDGTAVAVAASTWLAVDPASMPG